MINALRGHLGEYGLVVAKGPGHVSKLVEHVENPYSGVPDAASPVLRTLVEALRFVSERIDLLDREIARRARDDDEVRRLTSIPGVGPITATALAALAPPADAFRKGRDFAAWVGLTPLQHSTGGKQKLGTTSKMGERTLRRLLIIGASSVVRKALRQGIAAVSWLGRMLARKPRMLVIVALANKMARVAWALRAKREVYRAPTVMA